MKPLLAADLFCGAGGTSSGVAAACAELGRPLQLTAVNHWNVAIATHAANHPEARHYCANLDNLNPRELFPGRPLDLLWASPECTHHSVARGGKPISDQSRSTAWCVVRWAEALRPAVILVENVKEFLTWGPIGANGRPLQSKKGEIFRAWVKALEAIGYRVEWRILCAADYGDPTTRRRLFVQAVRGQRKPVWPEPTHRQSGETDLFTQRAPWIPARAIIDWSNPGKSIYARKKPLAAKTMRRIMAGLQKYGLSGFIVEPSHDRADCGPRDNRTSSLEEPVKTVVGSNRFALATPFLVGIDHQSSGDTPLSVDDPLSTVTTKQRHAVANPFLVHLRGTSKTSDLDAPAPTITSGGGHLGLTQPYLVAFYGTNMACPVTEPLGAVTTKERFALCAPSLRDSASPREPIPNSPLPTSPLPQIEIAGQRYLLDILFRMLTPKELAAAQGFPRDYQFTGTTTQIAKQIGNAVPVNLAKALAKAAIQNL